MLYWYVWMGGWMYYHSVPITQYMWGIRSRSIQHKRLLYSAIVDLFNSSKFPYT